MHEIYYEFSQNSLESALLPLLREQVFHVTNIEAYSKIVECDYLECNIDGKYSPTWNEQYYGKKRNLICLFDLRGITDDVVAKFRPRCDFLYDYHFGLTTAYLLLSKETYHDIIPNKVAVAETQYSEFFVPRLEAWYPRKLSISQVETVIIVKRKVRGKNRDGYN
jgi:hypothetical protein